MLSTTLEIESLVVTVKSTGLYIQMSFMSPNFSHEDYITQEIHSCWVLCEFSKPEVPEGKPLLQVLPLQIADCQLKGIIYKYILVLLFICDLLIKV